MPSSFPLFSRTVDATWGAGAFNSVNPIAGTYAERVPGVVVSGASGVKESASGWHLHHMSRALDIQSRIFPEPHLPRECFARRTVLGLAGPIFV